MKIPPCKRCGGTTVYRNCRAYGAVVEIFGSSGKHEETNTDRLSWTAPKRLRCEDCLEIRTDIEMWGMTVTIKTR